MDDLKYEFEEISKGDYQVRLKGEFVCYSNHKNARGIDNALKNMGYDSREDFLKECWRGFADANN